MVKSVEVAAIANLPGMVNLELIYGPELVLRNYFQLTLL